MISQSLKGVILESSSFWSGSQKLPMVLKFAQPGNYLQAQNLEPTLSVLNKKPP